MTLDEVKEIPRIPPTTEGRIAAAKVVEVCDAAGTAVPEDIVQTSVEMLLETFADTRNWLVVTEHSDDGEAKEINVLWVGPANPWHVAMKVLQMHQAL